MAVLPLFGKGEKEGGKGASLTFRLRLFFMLCVAGLCVLAAAGLPGQLAGITEAAGYEWGMPVIEKAGRLIDGDSFEALAGSLDPGDPWYEETRRALLAVKEGLGCAALYTLAPVEGNIFRVIIDGSVPPGEGGFSPLGAAKDLAGAAGPVLRAMETEAFQTGRLGFSIRRGWTLPVYGPVLNSSGKAAGIIGCEFNAGPAVYSRLRGEITRILVLSAFFAAAGLAAYLYAANGAKKQNRRLRKLRDVAEAASAALKDERDTMAALKESLRGGLFLMDKNFVIQEQYSHYMETLLGVKDLRGKRFTDLIADSVTKNEITSLIEYFVLLFNRSEVFKHNIDGQMLEELNPVHEMEYICPGTGEVKSLRCNFVPVDRGNGKLFILGNIHDITSEKRMQEILAGMYGRGFLASFGLARGPGSADSPLLSIKPKGAWH
jgi:hypothetical protein